MLKLRTAAAGGVFVCLFAGAALAQDKPPMLPTRDVAVVYRLASPDGKEQHTMKLFATGGGSKLRMESPERPGFMVMDRTNKTLIVVIAERKTYVEGALDPRLAGGFLLNEEMSFTKAGTDTVAGQACTLWDVQAPQGRTAKVCVTDDGVVLRGQSGEDQKTGSIEAVSVTYGPQAPDLFQPPADYQKVDMPRPGPGGAPPPQ
jgi:hypothetical protein